VRLDHEAKALLSREEEDRLVAAVEQELAAGATACIVSDYAKGVVSERVAQAVVAAAKRAGRPVVADPKSRSFTKYRGATMVTPNTHELELAVGRSAVVSDDEVVAAAGELLPELAGSSLLVTRGARGMSLFAPGTPALHLPTMAKAVYDVVGAGDTVVSTLALALAVGAPFDVAVRLANLAAGLAVSKPGTATVSQGELRAAAVHD
jgi:D-beta-D-heptose 7-phosphate kinase/D-beta-D-heptose 1-phosphate adenosyltransferase